RSISTLIGRLNPPEFSAPGREISISDTRGVFAEIHGIAIEWNPLALLTGTFHAKRFEIEAINVLRKPLRTLPSRPGAENSGGFNLPI
ncbi:hypothetical protein ACC687_39425, partial [Rhizobium ruizarguesonis]